MKRFLKLYLIEQKLALRSGDMLLFGVAMPVGVMILINMIAGQQQAGEGFTYLKVFCFIDSGGHLPKMVIIKFEIDTLFLYMLLL